MICLKYFESNILKVPKSLNQNLNTFQYVLQPKSIRRSIRRRKLTASALPAAAAFAPCFVGRRRWLVVSEGEGTVVTIVPSVPSVFGHEGGNSRGRWHRMKQGWYRRKQKETEGNRRNVLLTSHVHPYDMWW